MKDYEEILRTIRSASELSFVLAQMATNLNYMQQREYAKYEQAICSLRHDIASLTKHAASLNSTICRELTVDEQ